MMRLVCIYIALPLLCWGQGNLVPNQSFEEMWQCPTSEQQLYECHNWINPTIGSPDYFRTCCLPDDFGYPTCGIPLNAWGYQDAHSGEAYAGLFAFMLLAPNGREYIQVQLEDSIVPSIRYEVSFYASLSDNLLYAVGTLGAHLSRDPITRDDFYRFEVEPQILNDPDNLLTDPNVWVLITDTFSSRYGGERYLTIGNFNTDATSDTVRWNFDEVSGAAAYYYIDDVSVIALDSVPEGIDEHELDFSIYPNPAKELLQVSSERWLSHIRLLDMLGREVYRENVSSRAHSIDLSGVPPGLYLLEAQDAEGHRAVQKVMVQ